MTSLDNWDRSTNERITSPRSLKAMQSIGVTQDSFLYCNKADFERQWGEQYATRAAAHFNQRADDTLNEARRKRREILEERHRPQEGATVQRSSLADETSSLIEREKRKMEQLKKKQQQEIEQLMEHELKMQEIRERNERKIKKQMEREEVRRLEVEEQKRLQEHQKREMEVKKRQRELEEEELNRKKRAADFVKEQERIEKERIKELKRKEEARLKEEEQKNKQEEFLKKKEDKFNYIQKAIEMKRLKMEEKQQIRLTNLEMKRIEKKREAARSQEKQKQKISEVMQNNEFLLQKSKIAYEEKQAKNEEKRRNFEERRRKSLDARLRRAEEKSQEIQRILAANDEIEANKRKKYDEKMESLRLRKEDQYARSMRESSMKKAEEVV